MRPMSRRELFIAGAVSIAGGTAAAGAAAHTGDDSLPRGLAAAGDPPVVSGVVTEVQARTAVLDTVAGPVRLRLTEGAYVWREGISALESFLPGEEMVAEGVWQAGEFIAKTVMPLYRPAEGVVTSVGSDAIVVEGRSMRLKRSLQELTRRAFSQRVPSRGDEARSLFRLEADGTRTLAMIYPPVVLDPNDHH